jgi:hypothetical protein
MCCGALARLARPPRSRSPMGPLSPRHGHCWRACGGRWRASAAGGQARARGKTAVGGLPENLRRRRRWRRRWRAWGRGGGGRKGEWAWVPRRARSVHVGRPIAGPAVRRLRALSASAISCYGAPLGDPALRVARNLTGLSPGFR